MRTHTSQYTVRGVPPEVDRVLRERARHRKISINQLIVEELTRATIGNRQHADFSDLVGRWTPDPACNDILNQREIRADDWR